MLPSLLACWRSAVDLVLPAACHRCGAPPDAAGWCCAACRPAPAPARRCGRCAARLPGPLPDGATCAGCRRQPLALSPVVAAGDYGDPVLRAWVLAWKHGRRPDLAQALGAWLARDLARRAPGVLVPVPLHPLRRLERGHDQALGLARVLARHTGWPCVRALARTRATAPQGSDGVGSRRANVAGAFAAVPEATRRWRGRPIWLIDDVMTSGATLVDCARALRRAAGAPRLAVGAAVVARASAVARDGPAVETGAR